jgi:D-threo-aldose 1-dehydrogenase
LTHPAVCNVLPGPRSPEELDGILAWWDAKIPDALWGALAEKGLLAEGTPIPGGTA